MEDLRQRLKFDDVAVRSRCIQKIVQVVKKKAKNELITSSSVQIPELNLLWEVCADDSISVSNLAIRGIIYLVTNRHLDINYAINKFLSSLPSASNVYGIVKGITKLLISQNNENKGSSSYSLHRTKHPLIAVLQADENYLPLVLENIADAVSEDSLRGFQSMEPVICYILSNPDPKRKTDCSKSLLIETLLDTVKNGTKTAFYILRCIPLLQIEDYYQVVEASNFILKAQKAFISLQCDEKERIYISELLLLSTLSLSERSIVYGHDPTRLLDIASNVSISLSKVNFVSSYVNLCLASIAKILKTVSGEFVEKYASLAIVLLDFQHISPTITALLASSVIQLLPELSVISFSESSTSLLSQLLTKLEQSFLSCEIALQSQDAGSSEAPSCSTAREKIESFDPIYIEAFTFSVQSSLQCAKFAIQLDEASLELKQKWLETIKSVVGSFSVDNADMIFSLVSALFLSSPDNQPYVMSCLETFESILEKSSHLSTKLFALLLYKQSLLKSPESKFQILDFLPKSAAHKYAIPPVLSILKMMANDDQLKAQAIHLMLQLWKKHDRCFSYLHKLLIETHKIQSKDLKINEALIAQAAAIREICLTAPEKHGIEFLGILSKIFNESNDEVNLPAACLALDGVIHLCKSEITDLRSTWKMLGPKLSRDRRTLITCRMYKLLALVPDLQVKSCEYDKFMSEIAANIWKRISSGGMPPEAIAEAYKTLAKFPLDCHILKQLPPPAKANLQLPLSMKATPFEMGKLPEDVLTYIPGYCYIDLLKSLQSDIVLKGYSEFLHSLIRHEIEELPRSAYSQRKHLQKRQNTNDSLSKVPKFLCSQFEARKAPTLQKNIAVGVLLSYEPPLEVGKDGEPIKRSLASQSRFFEQVLSVLLNEVNIDITDWHRCTLLPSAWGAFMERAFFTCEESRRAELDLQRSLGHTRELTPEEFNLQCKCAWLWVRDRLLGVIKTSVKNAPTSHANAIFAISGLIQASNKFQSTLDDSTIALSVDNESYTNHETFVTEYAETIICAMISNYKTKGKVHSWLLTHLSRANSSAGFLVIGCSCASLCMLTSVLMNNLSDMIPTLFKSLFENLSHSSPVLSFYSGLGLGLFIRSLCEVGFTEVGEAQMELLLNTSKEIQKLCLSEETPLSCALISLTIAMASLSHISHEECKDWISTTCGLFQERLKEEEVSSMSFEMLSICVSAMLISAVEGNCMAIENISNLATWFEEKQSELPQCSGVSVSSGMLIEALEKLGNPLGSEIKQKLQKEWFNTLISEKRNILHKIAALNGLCSLYSSGRGLLQCKTREGADMTAVSDLVSLMFQMLNASRDTGLQNISSWEVGRLYSVHSLQQESQESIPANYSYLNEKSVLKPLIKNILGYQNTAEEDSNQVFASLTALGGIFPKPLPPLNWMAVLSPFLQQSENPFLTEAALNIALNQAKGSPYATNLLSSYCCPPLYHTLPVNCQNYLLKNIPGISQVLPPPKLKVFFQTIIPFTIKQQKNFQELGSITMQGIQETFVEVASKPQTLNVLQGAFISIFKYFKKDWNLLRKHLPWISEIFVHLSKRTMESLLEVSKNSSEIPGLTSVLCYLVKTGQKKLSDLRPCIEEGKHLPVQEKEQICAVLCECFLTGCANGKGDTFQHEKCISWLLETIGWINVLSDSKSQYQLMTISEVFHFLNDVCFATIAGCSGLECCYHWLPMQALTHQLLLENLPMAIKKLTTIDEWNKVTAKIIDWFMLLLQSPHLNESEKYFIKLSLCGLRSSSEFKKLDVWTNVVCSIYSPKC